MSRTRVFGILPGLAMSRTRVFGILPGLAMLVSVEVRRDWGSLTVRASRETTSVRAFVDAVATEVIHEPLPTGKSLRDLDGGYRRRRQVALLREQGWVGAPNIHRSTLTVE